VIPPIAETPRRSTEFPLAPSLRSNPMLAGPRLGPGSVPRGFQDPRFGVLAPGLGPPASASRPGAQSSCLMPTSQGSGLSPDDGIHLRKGTRLSGRVCGTRRSISRREGRVRATLLWASPGRPASVFRTCSQRHLRELGHRQPPLHRSLVPTRVPIAVRVQVLVMVVASMMVRMSRF
jgi:hypothetical protein